MCVYGFSVYIWWMCSAIIFCIRFIGSKVAYHRKEQKCNRFICRWFRVEWLRFRYAFIATKLYNYTGYFFLFKLITISINKWGKGNETLKIMNFVYLNGENDDARLPQGLPFFSLLPILVLLYTVYFFVRTT